TPVALFASGRRAPSAVREETLYQESDRALVAEVRSLGGTDSRMLDDPELLDMVLPAMRADYTAVMTYRCRPDAVIDSPLHVLIGDDDPQVDRDEALRWKEHTGASFALEVFPGGHFYLNDHAPAVLRYIAATLGVR
ncbi:thioesterase domain-containing protein, partial [Kitasatospora sp. NPDC050463]|uniref:thioesterase II family protein n=1 Tax=Kitasatospora sp. NPDC050463 TaxID=3155786 RepID=UPI0033E64DA5